MTTELAVQVLEAILLASSGKIKLATLKKFFVDFDLDYLIAQANHQLQNTGFLIYKNGQNVEIVTRPELAKYLINFFGFAENEATQDFLEVLAIIAYGGPIKLVEINKIRHKSSVLAIRSLVKEGLIKKDKFSYKVSESFLNFLGFKNVNQLPEYKKLRREIKKSLQ